MENESTKELIPASTLVLVRPHGAAFQVYLLRRGSGAGFMAGHYVFPGGVVEPLDADPGIWSDRVDLTAERVAARLGGPMDADRARGYAVAAIRETFEEAGVLLATGPGAGEALEGERGRRPTGGLEKGWLAQRVKTENRRLSLSALNRWSHWVTPEGMKRRFDTRFFLALMPQGQTCRPDGRETVDGIWTEPLAGLQANLDGRVPLSPPTVVTLQQLLAFKRLDDLMEHAAYRAWGEPMRPRLVRLGQDAVIVEPWDPLYPEPRIRIGGSRLATAVVPAGRPFSRIWLHDGVWRPVAGE